MIRSSFPPIDMLLCAAQGAVGAVVINSLKGVAVVSPANGALFGAATSLIERVIFATIGRFIPGHFIQIGPIPCGLKNSFSYGLATYTTLRIMMAYGRITHAPSLIAVVGIAGAVGLGGELLAVTYC